MIKTAVPTAAVREYAEAYEKHYAIKDVHAALQIYKGIVVEYPDSKEAEYSRSQIQNIVHNVVPKQVLYDAQLDLALNYANHRDGPVSRAVETTSPAADFST